MFDFLNKNKAPQQESFRGKDAQGFAMLRERIKQSAIEFEKKHLVEDAQELDRLTERVGRSLTMGGEPISEDILASDAFRETLAKALQVEPVKEGYMTVNAQGEVIATADSKKGIIEKIQDERAATEQNNQ